MKQIDNINDLKMWLDNNKIDTLNWGVQGTKSVQNLWDELKNGDCQLQLDQPERHVIVTEVMIQRGSYILIELEQEFGNGERRVRRRLPSEKMHPDEDCIIATLRCLKEELGVSSKDVSFLTSAYHRGTQETISHSYPGLRTKYLFYRIEVEVKDLPKGDFWRDNQAFGQGDPIKKHHWSWIRKKEYQD